MQNEPENPNEQPDPVEPVVPTAPDPALAPVLQSQTDEALTLAVRESLIAANKKPKWYKNKKYILLILVFVLILGASVAGGWFLLKKDSKGTTKLPANNYIANVSSCSKVTELLKRTYANESADALMSGSTTSRSNISNSVSMSASPASSGTKSAESSGDYSKTNVQVEGVDEADVVKNDGEYIYTISNGDIYIVKAYPAKDAALVAKLTLSSNKDRYTEGGASEIFISKDRLMAIGTKAVLSKDLPDIKQDTTGRGSSSGADESDLYPDYYDSSVSFTFIKVWDTTNKKSPKLVRSVEFEGDYSASRMIEENVHIVLNANPRVYNITNKTDGNDLIPLYSDVQGTEKASYKPACACEDVEYFKNSEKVVDEFPNSFVNVVSLSIKDDKKEASRRTIVGNSNIVYASANNLYLASMTYDKVGDEGYKENTQLHKFNLKNDSSQYQASATVGGTLLNQYSMDENNGNFRIAATQGEVWDETNKSTNHIYVLNKDMKQIGSLDNLAPGEKIYSSRFVGDRAYLVTFKKVDPFFVIDLKDPTKPAVLGYLKIPGYSDYLHPYDENHIIGVGKEAVDASSAQTSARNLDFAWYQGLKMAIFDVTNVSAPKEMHKVVIGDRGTDSPVLEDPKAFLFSKSKNLLVLPVSLHELTDAQKKSSTVTANTYGKFTYQGAYVYNVDLAKGFTLKGRITHASSTQPKSTSSYNYNSEYQTEVRRALYIGDNLYTISDTKILGNSLANLEKTSEVNLN